MQSAIVVVVVVVAGGGGGGGGGGRVGGRRTVRTLNYKRWGWDRSSNVQMLFENVPARLDHPLCGNVEKARGLRAEN